MQPKTTIEKPVAKLEKTAWTPEELKEKEKIADLAYWNLIKAQLDSFAKQKVDSGTFNYSTVGDAAEVYKLLEDQKNTNLLVDRLKNEIEQSLKEISESKENSSTLTDNLDLGILALEIDRLDLAEKVFSRYFELKEDGVEWDHVAREAMANYLTQKNELEKIRKVINKTLPDGAKTNFLPKEWWPDEFVIYGKYLAKKDPKLAETIVSFLENYNERMSHKYLPSKIAEIKKELGQNVNVDETVKELLASNETAVALKVAKMFDDKPAAKRILEFLNKNKLGNTQEDILDVAIYLEDKETLEKIIGEKEGWVLHYNQGQKTKAAFALNDPEILRKELLKLSKWDISSTIEIARMFKEKRGDIMDFDKIFTLDDKQKFIDKALASNDFELIRHIGGTLGNDDWFKIMQSKIPDEERIFLSVGQVDFNPDIEDLEANQLLIKTSQEMLQKYFDVNEIKTDPLIRGITNIFKTITSTEVIELLAKQVDGLDPSNRHLARLLKTLAETDEKEGRDLILKFMKMREMPDKIFQYFSRKLTRGNYFTEALEQFYVDGKNMPFIRRLLAQYPNQFNTTLETVLDLQRKSGHAVVSNEFLSSIEKDVFTALNELGTITPIIFWKYQFETKPSERPAFVKKIKDLKAKFFLNQPIDDIKVEEDPKENKEILSELVYVAYKPIGMSFSDVKDMLEKVPDETNDLKDYKFPVDGYDIKIAPKKVELRPGETIDKNKIINLRKLILDAKAKATVNYRELTAIAKINEDLSRALNKVAKASTDLKGDELVTLLSPMASYDFVGEFLSNYREVPDDRVYDYFSQAKEVLTIFFKDNYSKGLEYYFKKNPDVKERLLKVFSDPERVKTFRRIMGESTEATSVSEDELAQWLTDFISKKVLQPLRQEINKEIKKFRVVESGESDQAKNFKAYISKNKASFFAKASAGICTADDIDLFERPDHFHINIVENNEKVRGNIQAYLLMEPMGGLSLVLRGFNPNIDFESEISPRSFCESILEVAKKFKEDNKLEGVYITSQLGVYHALSNRETISRYLLSTYVNPENERKVQLKIAGFQTVNEIYKIK